MCEETAAHLATSLHLLSILDLPAYRDATAEVISAVWARMEWLSQAQFFTWHTWHASPPIVM